MAEFHSNITFVASKRQKEIEKLELIWNMDSNEHCCICDSPECNPSIPIGDCGKHWR